MADQGQRTEQPTDRRIQKAREEGNFPVSRDFVSSLQFAAFVAITTSFSAEWLLRARNGMRYLLDRAFHVDLTQREVMRMFLAIGYPAAAALAGAGVLLMAVTLGTQLGTTKMGFSVSKLTPDFKRLSPLNKIKNLPRQNVPQFFQALVLLPLFLGAVYVVVNENLAAFLGLPLLSANAGLRLVGGSVSALMWRAAALFLVVGVVDLVRSRRRYTKDLKMTKQEIRDEQKDVEGNPQIKAKVRRLQRELLRRQMMSEVPDATAVIVNPTHYAVAVKYTAGEMAAPKVVAKGKNYLAKRIRKLAMEHSVPIVENPPLARALYKSVDVGGEIPVHLYRAVAEILAYIYRIMNPRKPFQQR